MDSLISATLIMIEYDGVDDSSGCNDDFDRKFAS